MICRQRQKPLLVVLVFVAVLLVAQTLAWAYLPGLSSTQSDAVVAMAERMASALDDKTDYYLEQVGIDREHRARFDDWGNFSATYKIALAYHDAEQVSPDNGERFLALLAKALSVDYPSLANDETIKELKPLTREGKASFSTASASPRRIAPLHPIHLRAMLVLADYCEGPAALTVRELLDVAGLTDRQIFDIRCEFHGTRSTLIGGLSQISERKRNRAVTKMCRLIADHYPTLKLNKAIQIFLHSSASPIPREPSSPRGYSDRDPVKAHTLGSGIEPDSSRPAFTLGSGIEPDSSRPAFSLSTPPTKRDGKEHIEKMVEGVVNSRSYESQQKLELLAAEIKKRHPRAADDDIQRILMREVERYDPQWMQEIAGIIVRKDRYDRIKNEAQLRRSQNAPGSAGRTGGYGTYGGYGGRPARPRPAPSWPYFVAGGLGYYVWTRRRQK